MKGLIHLYQGGQLLTAVPNEIQEDAYAYLAERLNGDTDRSMDDLFGEYDAVNDQLGKDGIVFRDPDTSDWFTMETSFSSPPSSRSKRLRGIIIPEEIIRMDQLQLGHDLQGGGGDQFAHTYAEHVFSEENTFFEDVPVVVLWDIFID